MKGRGGHLFDAGKARQGTTENTWIDRVSNGDSPFILNPGSKSYTGRVPDNNNDDDGVSKCRFTITVFLPPCNMRPVYLLPPSPFSPVSQKQPPVSSFSSLLAPLCLQKGSTYVLLEQNKVGEATAGDHSFKSGAPSCCPFRAKSKQIGF